MGSVPPPERRRRRYCGRKPSVKRLPEELLEAYEALTRDWEELTQREAEQTFVQGFRSGARITLESLTLGEDDPAD